MDSQTAAPMPKVLREVGPGGSDFRDRRTMRKRLAHVPRVPTDLFRRRL